MPTKMQVQQSKGNPFFFILPILFVAIILSKCATPTPPTGGPKDTIPPTLLYSTPEDQKLNFKEKTFTLTFDERIAADKLKQSLIITPFTENKFKHFIKKNTITINFEDSFEDSTTYTLNFLDGITDITEKNPPDNLIIAFSTGDYIDSLTVFGTVSDLLTDVRKEKFLVALYKYSDTLDYKTDKPTYFMNTTKEGTFLLRNIKYGQYKLFAFADDNKNLLFDAATEPYGFKVESFNPLNITDSIHLHTVAIDASPLTLISARPSSTYFELRYSKKITSFEILEYDSAYRLFTHIDGEGNILRFYNPDSLTIADSIYTIVQSYDTLQSTRIDTTYIQFRSSNRKPPAFTSSLSPPVNTFLNDHPILSLKASKPLVDFSIDSFYIPIDTLLKIPVNITHTYLSDHKTKLTIETDLTRQGLLDTIQQLKKYYSIDTTANQVDTTLILYARALNRFESQPLNITSRYSSLVSADYDTLKNFQWSFNLTDQTEYGKLTIVPKTDQKSFILQLIKGSVVAYEVKSCIKCVFPKISPATYGIRVLIDQNEDEDWSPGNINTGEEPEPVFNYTETTEIRPNWEVELEISF